MVFLHGITRHGHTWDPLSDACKNDYHVLALDQRGHGATQWPAPPSYDTADYVDDLSALTEAWGLDRFVLVGLSMGAHNGLAFAARHPEDAVRWEGRGSLPLEVVDRVVATAADPEG